MNQTREQLRAEIRYAIRLTQRTARLYRRVQTVGTFAGILGGSAALTTVAATLPAWVALSGAALLALAGALLVAVRPADKAAQNEADVHRYQTLMAKSEALSAEALAAALDEAHQGDAPEIEPLRPVAWNDVMLEINRPDELMPLSPAARLLAALA
jgi:hypothetical protein